MMIHPSYQELMARVNKESTEDGTPVVTSRYSIVLATSKRARQINKGGQAAATMASAGKALSIAVGELYDGKVKIVSNNTNLDTSHPAIVEDIEAEAEPAAEEETAEA